MRSFNLEVSSTLLSVLLLIPTVYSSGKISNREIRRKITTSQPEPWTLIETHGLMFSHYSPNPRFVDGNPIISRRNTDIPLFSSSLSGLTSSDETFISWDDQLVNDLRDAPTQNSLVPSRDVVSRMGMVHLARDSKGHDELKIETLLAGASPPFLSSFSPWSIDSKLLSKRLSHLKRSSKKSKATSAADLEPLLGQKEKGLDVVKGAIIQTKITWYTGHDLLNPYCAQKSGWTPTDKSLIIAVTQEWKMRPKCGEFLELVVVDKHAGQVGKSVIARVVDLCGGCAPQVPHADLSKAAFTRLFNLDVGVVSGLAMRKVSPPKKWNNDLYGPRDL